MDTNVLVSALWRDYSIAAAIVKLMPQTMIPCLSQPILWEYIDVLNRPKFKFSESKREALLSKISEYGEMVFPEKSEIHFIDESDRVFYDTAMASGAILITGNLKHFPDEAFIMSPTDFLSLVE
jgi:putative PIN family toxin of toxin-antitoxin system